MTTYYVGPGGSDSNNGQTWAARKLTLNGVEDIPVAANDIVYVGPGVYRETLTCDISGSSGQPITYIGDVNGEHTDKIGGTVRVTGSDNDTTTTRANGFYLSTKNYRTFRGFSFDMHDTCGINVIDCNGTVVEDCYFGDAPDIYAGLDIRVADGDLFTVRRCVFACTGRQLEVYVNITPRTPNSSSVVENCVFIGDTSLYCLRVSEADGWTIKNCTMIGGQYGVTATITSGTVTLNNSIITACYYGVWGSATGAITEDYNCIYGNAANRTSTTTGSNSVSYPILLKKHLLKSGIQFPWNFLNLSEWSSVSRIAGTSESTVDLFGETKPTTASKSSWGAIQYRPGIRETTTTRGSSTASLAIPDAGVHQIFVAVNPKATTISVYVYREANYAGTNPQMIIKQPGQSDRTTTDTGSVSTWNQLTDTFTVQPGTDYVVVELRSNNTATSGSYAVYFDDLLVTQ